MASTAVSTNGLVIPLIDLDKFLHGSPEERKDTAKAMLTGFQTAGFVYLKNTPIASAAREKAFDYSARFFRLPLDTKLGLSWTTAEANRGFSAPGREKVTQMTDINAVHALKEQNPDIKESIEIGRDDEEGFPNQWPDETTKEAATAQIEGFRDVMKDFFGQCKAVHVEVMRAIAVGMGLDEHHFDGFVDVGDNTLRLLHYPSVDPTIFKTHPGQVRAGAHSDYGSITLLFQDDAGGLQVQAPDGSFVDATPIPDTIVVNAGDLLARWSNDTIKSTIHRVVEPPRKPVEGAIYPPRYSIAYFCNPNFKDHIEAIPGTYSAESEKKYEGINSGKYLVQRLAATY